MTGNIRIAHLVNNGFGLVYSSPGVSKLYNTSFLPTEKPIPALSKVQAMSHSLTCELANSHGLIQRTFNSSLALNSHGAVKAVMQALKRLQISFIQILSVPPDRDLQELKAKSLNTFIFKNCTHLF